MIPDVVAYAWLGCGVKYRVSAMAAGAAWDLPFSAALAAHHISLNGVETLEDLTERFRGRIRWKPDPWFSMRDLVLPPLHVLDSGGDDCDGNAGFMAAAIDYALRMLGWRGWIVSAFVKPWTLSHHFAIARDPRGVLHPVQPYPSESQPDNQAVIWPRVHSTAEDAARDVMNSYRATLVAFDVRDSHWSVVQPWRRLS